MERTFFLLVVIVSVTAGEKTYCKAVQKGEQGAIICHFGKDINRTKDSFTVHKFDQSGYFEEILGCRWDSTIVSADLKCETKPEYFYDNPPGTNFTLRIRNATEKDVWSYVCQVIPSSSSDLTPCNFTLKGTASERPNHGNYPGEGSVSLQIIAIVVGVVAAVALLVIFLILAICFWKRRRRTRQKMDDVTENQAVDTGFSLLRDNGDDAEMIPMKETDGETQTKLRHADSDEDETTSLSSSDIHKTLFEACKTGDVKKLKDTCTSHPNSLFIANNNGDRLIHVASRYDQTDVVSQLLRYGAPTCATNKQGRTPLHMASYYGAMSVIDVLLKDKAKTDAQDKNGSTPLHLACEKKENEDTSNPSKSKKKSGAEVASDEKIKSRQVDVVKKLLGAGVEVCVVDAKGQTPLHLACLAGNKEIVQILIDYGADLTVTDENGLTPALLAKKNGHKDIAKQISEHLKEKKKQAKKKMKLTEKDLWLRTVQTNVGVSSEA